MRSGRENMLQNCWRTRASPKVGNGREFGRSSLTSGTKWRRRRQAIEGQEAETLHPLGTPQPDLDRHPPTERVADQMGPADPRASMKRQTARANQAAS